MNSWMSASLASHSFLPLPLPSARWTWKAGERNRVRPGTSLFTISEKKRFDRAFAVAVGCASFGAGRTLTDGPAAREGPTVSAAAIAIAARNVLRFMKLSFVVGAPTLSFGRAGT